MDITEYLNAMMEQAHNDRKGYHVTLGELIEFLSFIPRDCRVDVSNEVCSYRGYYSDLAIIPGNSTAGELLDTLNDVLDTELVGYKGGEFLMDSDTPVWVADYGCTGLAMLDAQIIQDELDKVHFTLKKTD